MQIRFDCPNDCVAIIEYEPLEQCSGTIECPRCHKVHTIKLTEAIRNSEPLDQCAICECRELFVRKDFPQSLGVGIVVVFGITALYFFQTSILAALAVLTAAGLIDLFIYLIIGKVTICYACRAQYRRGQLNPAHEGFDLAASEKY